MPYVSCSAFNAAITALQNTPGGLTQAQVAALIATSQAPQDAAIAALQTATPGGLTQAQVAALIAASQAPQDAAIAALQNISPNGLTLAQVNAAIAASQATQDAAINASQQLQDVAILNAVTTATFNASQDAQNTAITNAFTASQAAQDAASVLANQLQDVAILNAVTTANFNASQQLQDVAILNAVTTATFNVSQDAQNTAIAALQAAASAPSVCIGLYQYIENSATNSNYPRLIVKGLPPGSVVTVTSEDITGTFTIYTETGVVNALGVADIPLGAQFAFSFLNPGYRILVRHPTCTLIERQQAAVLSFRNPNGQGDGDNTDGSDSPDGSTDT